jgi:hypothetical protein
MASSTISIQSATALAATRTTHNPLEMSRDVTTLNAMIHSTRKTSPHMITVAAMRRTGPRAEPDRMTGS